MPEPRIIGLSRIGADTLIDEGVVIGYPAKATLLDRRDFSDSRGAIIGQHCIFRREQLSMKMCLSETTYKQHIMW